MTRALLAFSGIGAAGALGYRGDWTLAVMVAAVALAPAVRWVRGDLAATAAMLREHPELMTGRHRKPRSRKTGETT